MRKRYSAEEKRIIFSMFEEGRTNQEISRTLKQCGYDRTPRQIALYKYDNRKGKLRPDKSEYCSEAHADALEGIEDLRGRLAETLNVQFVPRCHIAKEKQLKVVVLTDIHVPFEMVSVITHMLENHSDADILIIGGDFFECYGVSAFRKSRAIPFRYEYDIALEYIKLFTSVFNTVVLVDGNHERRLPNYIRDQAGNMLRGLIHDNAMQMLADGLAFDAQGQLTKQYSWSNVVYDAYPRGDYVRVGNLVVSHFNDYSSIPMRTSISVTDKLIDLVPGLQCTVQGHTHQQGKVVHRNRLIIESGCACTPMEYTIASGRLIKNPHTFGYTVAYIDDAGNVDFGLTGPIYLGIGQIIKPEALDVADLIKKRKI